MSGTTIPGDQRPLRQDAVRNRERLVVAARETFHRSGLDAPLDEIARRAGVSVGTLYNRFSSRGELVDAALGPVVERSVEIAERATQADDPWNGFVAFMEQTCELLAAEPQLHEDRIFALLPSISGPFDTLRRRSPRSGTEPECRPAVVSRNLTPVGLVRSVFAAIPGTHAWEPWRGAHCWACGS